METPRIVKVFALVFFFLVCTIIASFLGVGVTALFGDGYLSMHLVSTINQLGMWLLPAVAFMLTFSLNPVNELHIRRTNWSNLGWGILLYIVSYGLSLYLGKLNESMVFAEAWSNFEASLRHMEDSAREATIKLFGGENPTVWNLLLCLFTIAVVPAICEEVFFRGVIFTNLLRWTKRVHLSVWLSAMIFSAVHMQFYGFLPRWIMGAILAYAFIYTRSIWVPVAIHFFNNAFTVIAYYAYLKDWLPYDPLTQETEAATWWMAAISLVLSIVVIRKKAIIYNRARSSSQ